VAIYRLLQMSAFVPEDIERIVAAYERALVQLGLNDRNDPLTDTVARLIIEVAQTGVKDRDVMCALALSRLGGRDREAC
jgi:hypothetical protein